MFLKRLKAIKAEYAAAGAAIFILAYILMLRPIIGVADNGDFPRIMGSTGLQYLTGDNGGQYFGFVNRLYRVGFVLPLGGGYFSTGIFMVGAAVFLSQLVWSSGIFDIRYLAFLYSVVFVAAIFLIVKYTRRRLGTGGWLLAGLLVFMFADIGYISYFNSLYGEAVTLVFLLLMAGSGLCLIFGGEAQGRFSCFPSKQLTAKQGGTRGQGTCPLVPLVPYRLWMLVVFFASAAFFTGAKIQNCPAGILAALLGLRMLKLGNGKAWRKTVILGVTAVVAVAAMSYVLVSRDIKVCNKYQTVFYGILKDSPDPAADLEELGLDPDLAVLAGTNYFMDSYPLDIRSDDFKNRLYDNVDPFSIAGFYLRHPDRFLEKLRVAAQNAFKLKQGFGNYERYKGIPFRQTADIFGIWSDFKMEALPHSLLFIVLFYAVFFCVLVFEYIRGKDARNRLFMELVAFIGLTGLIQLAIPIIGDGEADLSKHLFLFNAAFDCMFAAAAVYGALRCAQLVSMLRRRSISRHA